MPPVVRRAKPVAATTTTAVGYEDDRFERSLSPLPSLANRSRVTVKRQNNAKWRTTISDTCIDLLFDWTLEAILSLEHGYDTAEVAFRLLRLFLLNAMTHKREWQLASVAAIWIATKTCQSDAERRGETSAEELAYMTDDAYTQREIVQMERRILQTIDYRVPMPCVDNFLHSEYPSLAPESFEFRSIQYIVLVALTKCDMTKALVPSACQMILHNKICETIRHGMCHRNLPEITKWFGGLVVTTVKLKYDIY